MSVPYDDIKQAISDAPQTFLPALLANCVEACIDKKVFRDNSSIEKFVSSVIQKTVLNRRASRSIQTLDGDPAG
jgi:hypothetical protein